MPQNKTFYIHTLGCKVNLYESNAVSNLLINSNYQKVSDWKKSDIYLINTCSVTNRADSKSRYFINKAIKANKVVVVMGCFSQVNADVIDPKIAIFIGNKYRNQIPHFLDDYFKNGKQIVKIDNLLLEKNFEIFKDYVFFENTRAFLKIQDGCNYMCSYCIIPFSRGKQRSMFLEDVLKSLKKLIDLNYQEIVLTGVNTAGYLDDHGNNFYDLLVAINALDGNFRIRISSVEPFQINDQIINLITSNKKRFCQHIHLCLQSGCDQTLKNMNRKYTFADFFKIVKTIYNCNPLCSITTDYIVGFHNESNKDFEISVQNILKVSFADMHIFPFSLRQKTAAFYLTNPVSSVEKKKRFQKVALLKKHMTNNYLKQFLNQTVNVLFEQSEDSQYQKGHSEYFFMVYVKTKENLQNQLHQVMIKSIKNNRVIGVLK